MQRETLEGVRVLDIATVIAGPWGAGILADFGAEVIKVEMPGRGDAFRAMGPLKDGVSTRRPCMGRNKKSVTLDFHYDEGKKLFLELVKKSDVLIENFRTGTLDKRGIGMTSCARPIPTSSSATSPATARPAPTPSWRVSARRCRRSPA